jgi:hypothetical protein
MKKYTLTIIALCIISLTINAQTISGIVVDETDTPIESVNVVLNTADSVFIEGTTTNKSGEFTLRKGNETLNRLTFSYTGYQTKIINVTQGNVGKIIILSDILALKEAVVIGSNTTFKDGKRIVRPTTEQIEKSPTGFILLDNIDLPRLNVDILKNSVSVMGGGSVAFMINGREANNYEVTALDTKNIISVEYSDIPSARFAGASITLNFIVKQVEKGGMFLTDLTNGLTMVYGADVFSAKFYNGASQFSVSYMPQFRDLKSQWRSNEESFYFNGTTIQRKEVGDPARVRYLFNNLNFSYNYFKNNRIFDVSLSSEIENQPDNNFKSKLFTTTSADTLFMTDNSRNTAFTPRLRLYYQEPLGKHQMLYASISGSYNQRNYKRDYNELYDNRTVENYFYSDVDEKQQVYNASVSYENIIEVGTSGWKLNLISALNHDYIKTENIYNNELQKTTTKMDVNRSKLSTNAFFVKDRSYFSIGLSLYRNSHSVENVNVTNYNLYFGLSGKYAFSKTSGIRGDFVISGNQVPSLSALSSADQFIDSLQIRRGNPYLKTAKFYQGTISYDFEMPNVYIYIHTKYSYTANPIMENSYLEGNYIIRTMENHKNFQNIQPYNVSITLKNMWSFLNITFLNGFDRYISKGNTYTHTNNIFWFGGRVSLKHKKFQLVYEISNRGNDGFFGETLTKDQGGDRLTLFYVTTKFYMALGCNNLFLAQSLMKAQINYSNVAPYHRYEYMDTLQGKGIFIKFVKTFRWGQQKNEANIRANDEKAESAILKGQK